MFQSEYWCNQKYKKNSSKQKILNHVSLISNANFFTLAQSPPWNSSKPALGTKKPKTLFRVFWECDFHWIVLSICQFTIKYINVRTVFFFFKFYRKSTQYSNFNQSELNRIDRYFFRHTFACHSYHIFILNDT